MVTSFVKAGLRRLGIDIKRLSPFSNFGVQIARILTDNGFDLVFDVGANFGQVGEELRELGYRGRIVSFEPLSFAHARLTRAAARYQDWTVFPACALGAAPGRTEINVSGMHASSSLLAMSDRHELAAPGSATVRREQVMVHMLADVGARYVQAAAKIFLKIDTQGYELEVLKGAEGLLPHIDAIQLEMSLVELYHGQPLWLDLIAWMEQRGFELTVLNQSFVDGSTLRTLQVDGLFSRRGSAR